MKAFVLFMALCIAAFPFIEGNAYAMQKSASDKCCHKMTKYSPCSHAAKKQCNPVACQSMIGCTATTFLKTEALTPALLFPLGVERTVAHHGKGSLSEYSSVSWRPPAV
jgi:hypothetical protein